MLSASCTMSGARCTGGGGEPIDTVGPPDVVGGTLIRLSACLEIEQTNGPPTSISVMPSPSQSTPPRGASACVATATAGPVGVVLEVTEPELRVEAGRGELIDDGLQSLPDAVDHLVGRVGGVDEEHQVDRRRRPRQ